MLLAIKKTIIPTKYHWGNCFVWESNSSLLQKNIGLEKESISFKGKGRTCPWSSEMCATELWLTQTIMIYYIFFIYWSFVFC